MLLHPATFAPPLNRVCVLFQSARSGQSISFYMAAQTHFNPGWKHDVFLSFRGEDTRKNFVDHLFTALMQAGIRTFRDDEELPIGKKISEELINAIRGSRLSVVVFSKDYASSRWCLDELVEILHCKNSRGHALLPIFYDVNPSDVREQSGTFAAAFAKHEKRFQAEMERLQQWRAALTEAANLSCWDLQDMANGYESRFIKKIVEEILRQVHKVRLHVALHPVGMVSRVGKVKTLLDLGTSDVRIVGIYGMGGIGKTTIAKAVYNELCHEFEGSSFLSNIKEVSEKSNGLIHLQEQLLYDILKTKNLKIGSVDRGINLIKERLHRKRVLIVLDDLDHLYQLNSLAGNIEWFGPGSRLIATTRDQQVLIQLGVNENYEVEELNSEESLQLFSWHAFKKPHPIENYLKHSLDVVDYAGGLPLALEVLGSYLRGRSIIEWKSTLEKLQKTPHQRIQKILIISFDSLDDTEKAIFLDIACFFIGTDTEYVSKVHDGCDFFPDIGMSVLIQRSLLTINERNELRMHDLIRDMGREVVREKSPNNLGERSRLWFHEEVLSVLRKHMGLKEVEGIVLNMPVLEDVHLKTEAFAKMKQLRLLQIDGVYLSGCFEHLSEELRWLRWHNCPLDFLPANFHLENLVVLDMQQSNIKQVWKDKKIFNKLKVLNLTNSKYLIKSPNFVSVPHMETVILEGCTSLIEVHESIGHLENLILLNLKGCENLRKLPESISNAKSLEILDLFGCSKLNKLPEKLGLMTALKKLHADRTAITQLPPSFGLLKNLETVSLSGCKGQSSRSLWSGLISRVSPFSKPINLLPASVSGLHSLRELDLSDCSLCENGIPMDFGNLPALEVLNLERNKFVRLPDSISRLSKLSSLILNECTSLQSISELPASLTELKAIECTSLERVSNLAKVRQWNSISLLGCDKLVEIQGLEKLLYSITHTDRCYTVSYSFTKNILQSSTEPCRGFPFQRSVEILDTFSHQKIGSSISIHVPSLSKGRITGIAVCAVFAVKNETTPGDVIRSFELKSNFFHNQSQWFNACRERCSFTTVIPISSFKAGMESGTEIKVSFDFGEAFEVIKCGIRLNIYEPDITDEYGTEEEYYEPDITDEYGTEEEYADFDTPTDSEMEMECAKRGRDDNEAGSSNDWADADEGNCSK